MTSEAVTNAQERRWVSYWTLLLALWLGLTLLAIKVWISWATRSLGLAIEVVHTFVTSFSLLLSLFAVSASPHPSRHWGHSRLEAGLSLLLIGFVGFVCCLTLGFAAQSLGWINLVEWELAPINLPLLQLLAAVTAVQLGLGVFGRHQARLLESTTLRFSFNQTLLDAGLTILVLGGLFSTTIDLHWLNYWLNLIDWLDLILGGVVLLMVIVSMWRIVNQQLPSMMRQVAIAPEAVARTTRCVEGILHCYNIQSRGLVGRLIQVEMHLILHPECVEVAPAIVQRVERLITQQYGPAKVVVHIDSGKA